MTPSLPVAITLGDPCGIGPEIVLKAALARPAHARPWLVYGDLGVLQRTAQHLGLAVALRPVASPEEVCAPATKARDTPTLAVLACSTLPPDLALGQVDARAGQAALNAIHHACDDALAGRVSAVVTAPIHKEAIARAGVHHPGHTEILAERAGVSTVRMMLVNDELRTVLATLHEPLLQAVAGLTTEKVLDTLLLAQKGLCQLGLPHGRIAVAGVNPHAGEHGLLGSEEERLIVPAIAAAQARGINASGPWPGDTIFMRARGFKEFDLVVAMYHDRD